MAALGPRSRMVGRGSMSSGWFVPSRITSYLCPWARALSPAGEFSLTVTSKSSLLRKTLLPGRRVFPNRDLKILVVAANQRPAQQGDIVWIIFQYQDFNNIHSFRPSAENIGQLWKSFNPAVNSARGVAAW